MNLPTPVTTSTTPRRRTNLLLGITGSVAAVKGPEIIVKLLSTQQYNIQVVFTKGGYHFWKKASDYDSHYWSRFQSYRRRTTNSPHNNDHDNDHGDDNDDDHDNDNVHDNDNDNDDRPTLKLHTAQEEWDHWNSMGDSVLHIELRHWADIGVIAPLSAHTLAKMAHGFCDDTLSCVVRAWNFTSTSTSTTRSKPKPLLVAPAMNTAMWDHPLTHHQLQTIGNFFTIPQHNNDNDNTTLKSSSSSSSSSTSDNATFLFQIIPPQVKTLACGDVGAGALASVEDILTAIDHVRIGQQLPPPPPPPQD